MKITQILAIGLIATALSACAPRFSGISSTRFDAGSQLLSGVSLSSEEKSQVVEEFKKAAGGPRYIYEVFMETPEMIQILTLDHSKMEYGSGRIFRFKKTGKGWRFDTASGIDFWDAC